MGRIFKKIVTGALILTFVLSCDDKAVIVPYQPVGSADLVTAWHPNGEILAIGFSGNPRHRLNGIYLVDTISWTTTELFVPKPSAGGYPPILAFGRINFSSDGSEIIFDVNGDVYRMTTDSDSTPHRITTGGGKYECDWRDSDSLLLYHIRTGDSMGIYISVDDGSNRHRLTFGDGGVLGPGDSVTFRSYSTVEPDRRNLQVLALDSSGYRIVLSENSVGSLIAVRKTAISSRGDILFEHMNDTYIIVSGTSGSASLVMRNALSPTWHPNDSIISFTRLSMQGGEPWISELGDDLLFLVPGWDDTSSTR